MKSLGRVLLGSGFLFLSSAALADGGFYVGVDVGRSKLEAQSSFEPDIRRQNDTGYKLRLGYQFIRYVALEVGYADFGEIEANDISRICRFPSQACLLDVRSKTRGALINVVGSWPFAERWALNGRLGALRARVSTTEQDPAIPASRNHESDTNAALAYGAGVSYDLNEHVTFSIDWAKFDQFGIGPGFSGTVGVYDLGSSSLASLGFNYRF